MEDDLNIFVYRRQVQIRVKWKTTFNAGNTKTKTISTSGKAVLAFSLHKLKIMILHLKELSAKSCWRMILILSDFSVNIWSTLTLLALKLAIMFCKDKFESNYRYYCIPNKETKEEQQYAITYFSLKQ